MSPPNRFTFGTMEKQIDTGRRRENGRFRKHWGRPGRQQGKALGKRVVVNRSYVEWKSAVEEARGGGVSEASYWRVRGIES